MKSQYYDMVIENKHTPGVEVTKALDVRDISSSPDEGGLLGKGAVVLLMCNMSRTLRLCV